MLKRSLLFLFLIFNSNGWARISGETEFLVRTVQQEDPTDGVIEIFKALSKTYRYSNEEGPFREWLRNLFDEVVPWQWANLTRPIWLEDRHHNVLLRLPGTGRFTGTSTVILHAHQDMVFNAKPLPKTLDGLKALFRNGVDIVEEDGWLHSRGFRTTLGADDGIGIALALRYLLHPHLEHPPLDILLTVDEERGMSGVKNLEISFTGIAMISLDIGEEGEHLVGSAACRGGEVSRVFQSRRIPENWTVLQVSLKGAVGGHSSMKITEGRLHPVNAAMSLLRSAMESARGDIGLVQMRAGHEGIRNAIPSKFVFQIAVPSQKTSSVEDALRGTFHDLLSVSSEEDRNKVFFSVEKQDRRPSWAITGVALRHFVASYFQLPLKFETDPRYEPSVLSTTNVSFLELQPRPRVSRGRMEYFSRTFRLPFLEEVDEGAKALWAQLEGNEPVSFHVTPGAPVWDAGSSWLSELFQKEIPEMGRPVFTTGGVEAAVMQPQHPGMAIGVAGPNIRGAHAPTESLERASAGRVAGGVDRALILIGEKELQNSTGCIPRLLNS